MPRATLSEQLAACRAQNYRLTRLLIEHDIDLPGNAPTPIPPARIPNPTAEDFERMRLALADIRAKLNHVAHRTEYQSWAAEARAVIRVIDRAEPRVQSTGRLTP